MILVDTEGHVVVRTGMPLGSPVPPVTDATSYRRVLATGEPVIGNLAGPGPADNGGPPRASFRVPVLRDGKIRFVLTGVVSIERLSALLDYPGLDPAWRPYLVDGSDRVAANLRMPARVGSSAMPPTIAAREAGSVGVYDATGPDGEPLVTAFRKSDRTGWSVHLAIPLALYTRPQTRAVAMVGVAAVTALGLSGLFALLLRRELRSQRRKTLQQERAIRMDALGRMTGGVAHDFNNLLMVISGNLEMLGRRLSEPRFAEPRLERYVTAIRKAAERGTGLTRDLLAFSRGQGTQAEIVDLNGRLGAALPMIQQSVGGEIRVETDLSPGRHAVRLDLLQFDLALLNIAANARDAMPDGGRLRIATRLVPVPGSTRAGIALSMTDTGSGIPKEALPHVFEPFFTTKEVGKGTGLGLSQVYGFVKAAGGVADIESRTGQGTTVTLVLPLAPEGVPVPTPSADVSAPIGTASGSIRVVLVDDNEEVRGVTAAFLEEAGMRVEQASSAQAGLALLDETAADVLVSDLVMPGTMDGLALANEVRRRWPALPIILVSGYSTSAAAATEQGYTLYMKPFDVIELVRAIRGKLDVVRR
ncbi:ATP-binding protein [Methylobacterium sp. Gmos1]